MILDSPETGGWYTPELQSDQQQALCLLGMVSNQSGAGSEEPQVKQF